MRAWIAVAYSAAVAAAFHPQKTHLLR
jgi:hypothetical protein